MKRNLFFSGVVAAVVSLSSIGAFVYFTDSDKTIKIEHVSQTANRPAINTDDPVNSPLLTLDFNATSEKVLNGVVHIKSTQIFEGNARQHSGGRDPFRDFFGDDFERFFGPNPQNPNRNQPQTRVGTGSGVIISDDGYIVTNNHVIANADDIEVTLHDNRSLKATVIGTDPSTDLALIQVKEKDLPTVPLSNSDEINVGEWVLAVGNPLGLNSTVTAGIVSAKGRNINILKDEYAVENFIQTDAAINPGNSGGALVNVDGGLVGINTAIASPTGTFAGYGFAIPSNLVLKVVEDLMEYGVVQRGVLGVMIRTIDGNLMKDKELTLSQGVYVDSLTGNSAAAKAGIKKGDIITSVNEKAIKTSPELQGAIAQYRPGETVNVTVNRKGDEKVIPVKLNNRNGGTNITKKETSAVLESLGAEFAEIDKKTAKQLEITGGVKVKKLYAGKLRKHTQMREGFIITSVDGTPVESIDDLTELLDKKSGGVMLEGVYSDIPGVYYYAFGM